MKTLFTTLALALATTGAMAYHCPQDMAAIDAKLAAGVQLSDADMARILERAGAK